MADDELAAFRERWKQEITSKSACAPSPSRDAPGNSGRRHLKNRYFEDFENLNKSRSPSKPGEGGYAEDAGGAGEAGGKAAAESEDQPEYVSIASSLLDGRTSPLLERIQEERTRRKRQYHNRTSVCSGSPEQQQQQQQQPRRKVKKDEELVDQLIQDLV